MALDSESALTSSLPGRWTTLNENFCRYSIHLLTVPPGSFIVTQLATVLLSVTTVNGDSNKKCSNFCSENVMARISPLLEW